MAQEFAAVLLSGLVIFGLAFVASQEFNFSSDQPDKVVFAEHSFGKVGDAKPDSRTVGFGDFSVGEGRGDVLVDRRNREDIDASFLDSDKVWIGYNATQPRGGKVTFEVLGREGGGAVYVNVNGEDVFKEQLVSGGTPEIEIPNSALKTGDNTIVIGTTSGGIFSSSEYVIEDIKVWVNDRRFHDYINTFKVYGYEVEDFVEGRLNFNIRSAVKPEPLEVWINDRNVYTLSRVRGREQVDVNPENADLNPGLNVIKFETDGEAKYEVENAQLTLRYLGATERKTLSLDFEAKDSELNFAGSEETREYVSFEYQNLLGSPRSMVLELNGNSHPLTPQNGENTVELSSDEFDSQNTLVIKSNGTYQMNNLRLVSERVEN